MRDRAVRLGLTPPCVNGRQRYQRPGSPTRHLALRALITGISGFLGRHLAEALRARGVQGRGISRHAEGAACSGFTVERFDLADRARLERSLAAYRPTHVFHLAGALRASDRTAEAVIRANVTLTQELMDCLCRLDEAPVVVVPGSAAVYGRPRWLPIDESHPVQPMDLYGVTKASQELVVDQHHRAWGCPVRILRIFNMIGPGQPDSLLASSVARQVVQVEQGRQSEIEVGDLSTLRDLVDVRDVARACVEVAELDVAHCVFNVCSGVATRMSDCVDRICQASTSPVRVVRRAARARRNDIAEHRGSCKRIGDTLGWRAEVPLERSMQELLDEWRERLRPDASA